MAYALQFDGVNDYLTFADFTATGDFTLSGSFNLLAVNTTSVILGSEVNNNNFIALQSGVLDVRIGGDSLTTSMSISAGVDYDWSIVRAGSSVDITLNGVTENKTTTATAFFNRLGRVFAGLYLKGNLLGVTTLSRTGDTRSYDVDASSYAAGTPVLTDTIGGNDATGVNMPTDGSAWVELTPWALQFDGVNDYVLFDTQVNESSTQWRLEWRAKPDDSGTAKRVIGKISGSTDYITTRHTSTEEKFTAEFNNVVYDITGGIKVTDDGEFHDLKIVANGTQLEYFVDGISQGTVTGSPVFEDMDCIGRGGSSYYEGQIEYMRYYDTSSGDVLKFNWDATASSHTAGTLVLTDTIGGNNATGVNMPTDGSAWVELVDGSLTIIPTALVSSIVFYTPTVSKALVILPDTISSTLSLQDPTVLKSKLIELDTIASTLSLQDPAVLKAKLITLDTILSSVSVQDPEILKSKLITPDTIASAFRVWRPLVTGGLVVTIGGSSFRIQIQWQGLNRI